MSRRVLVTGGTGFVGSHAVLRLLADGYQVRATVRSERRAEELRGLLATHRVGPEQLEFAIADLTSDEGWAAATRGCDVVLHVASPFPAVAPSDPEELIGPARDGTLRVLRAARTEGVRRVVLTSSFAAVGYTAPSQTTRPTPRPTGPTRPGRCPTSPPR